MSIHENIRSKGKGQHPRFHTSQTFCKFGNLSICCYMSKRVGARGHKKSKLQEKSIINQEYNRPRKEEQDARVRRGKTSWGGACWGLPRLKQKKAVQKQRINIKPSSLGLPITWRGQVFQGAPFEMAPLKIHPPYYTCWPPFSLRCPP